MNSIGLRYLDKLSLNTSLCGKKMAARLTPE
jgi:hypothetical protein